MPADPSSAAFLAAAAACLPGASIEIRNVCVNPLRTGFFETLREMGAGISRHRERHAGGEPVADFRVAGGELGGIEIPPERAPAMIDEYPVLAVVAACARGRTTMRGLAELRVKESDRLAAVAAGLAANGVRVEERDDGLIVDGAAGRPPGGATVATGLDHRIAMAFLVLGLLSREGVAVDDTAPVATSFPGFVRLLSALGAKFDA